MAMKERKQITGTTAQIDDYEGHEGQIVWDKEKKTFVGMSGTAGKNYPLASQAYVDTQFLPLTGGELTGEVAVKGGDGRGAIYQKDNGASIFLFAPNHSTYKGGFVIRARGTEGSELDLISSGDGTLSWKGNEIVRTGVGNKLAFSIGASGARYTAPVTGRCVIAGGFSIAGVNGATVELYNNQTLDQMATGITPNNGWMRGQINVRKGDAVSIYYYNWDRAEAFWIEQ